MVVVGFNRKPTLGLDADVLLELASIQCVNFDIKLLHPASGGYSEPDAVVRLVDGDVNLLFKII